MENSRDSRIPIIQDDTFDPGLFYGVSLTKGHNGQSCFLQRQVWINAVLLYTTLLVYRIPFQVIGLEFQ